MNKGLRYGWVCGYAALFLGTVLFFSGCNSKTVAADIPDWYLNPAPPEDVLWGVGSAKMPDVPMAMVTAEARARESLAYTLSTTVTDTGEGLSLTSTAEIKGAQVIKRAVGKDGVAYVLVEMAKPFLFDDGAAGYAEFKAGEALRLLDEALLKESPQQGEN